MSRYYFDTIDVRKFIDDQGEKLLDFEAAKMVAGKIFGELSLSKRATSGVELTSAWWSAQTMASWDLSSSSPSATAARRRVRSDQLILTRGSIDESLVALLIVTLAIMAGVTACPWLGR